MSASAAPQTVDRSLSVRLMRIERRRVDAKLSTGSLIALAGYSASHYRAALAGKAAPRIETVVRLERALGSLLAGKNATTADEPLLRAVYSGFVTALASAEGVDPADVHAQDPRKGATADRAWRRIAQVRQAAIYLTNTTLGVRQSRLAELLGLTPAAICLGLRSVEDRRDDPAFAALLDRIAGAVMGGGL